MKKSETFLSDYVRLKIEMIKNNPDNPTRWFVRIHTTLKETVQVRETVRVPKWFGVFYKIVEKDVKKPVTISSRFCTDEADAKQLAKLLTDMYGHSATIEIFSETYLTQEQDAAILGMLGVNR